MRKNSLVSNIIFILLVNHILIQNFFNSLNLKSYIMKTRYFFSIILLLGAIILFAACNGRQKLIKKPNIILILADDLGWKDAGFMGSKYYETPALDALAANGMSFTNAYANAPNCAPSRACLLTGLYTPRHGIYTVNSSARGRPAFRKIIPIENKTILDTSFITIAEVLGENGYTSSSIGKWHLGNDSIGLPQSQGFDENVGGYHLGHPKSYFSPYKNPYLSDGPEGEYLTDRLTDEALGFIERNKDNPFFLYLPHYAVHTPIQARDSITEIFRYKEPDGKHSKPEYAAMIKSLDDGIGKLMEKVDELGISENTIIIFMSDNGGLGMVTGMEPLRGSKGMLYEGGIRVPLIISWPGKIRPSTISDIPVIGTDLFPTILKLAHIKPSKDLIMDGENLKRILLKGKKIPERPIFWHFPAYLERTMEIRDVWRSAPASAIRFGDWKLIEFYENRSIELYNLKEDIGETNNLSEKFPVKKNELYKLLDDWRKEVNAPVPTETNPEFDELKYEEFKAEL